MIRKLCKTAPGLLIVVQLLVVATAFGASTAPDATSPFVICDKHRYALCATASCFVYDGVASCKCDVMHGDSISLQLSYSSSTGDKNVCDVNQEGDGNGFMVSTFSLPAGVQQGGTSAVYTCPGTDNAGSGVVAPVAYGQCDGGICWTSSRGQRFPGFEGKLTGREIMCSCPVSTTSTAGSSDSLGYQIFGPYHPSNPVGSRCDASACAACSISNPTANGTTLPVGAPTGTPAFLTQQLDGSLPPLNQCLCSCSTTQSGTTCTVGQDQTP